MVQEAHTTPYMYIQTHVCYDVYNVKLQPVKILPNHIYMPMFISYYISPSHFSTAGQYKSLQECCRWILCKGLEATSIGYNTYSSCTKCYRCLHNNHACLYALVNVLTWQSSCVIANHCAAITNYIMCKPDFCVTYVISRRRNRLLSLLKLRSHTLLKEYRRIRKGMKDKRNRHGAVGKSSSEQHFRKSTITFIV